MSFETASFKQKVKAYYRRNRRDFPWRRTTDPYKILVSEVMLQQTQTDRVVPKFDAFIKKFPTVQSLARASLAEVLALWQGLGYNRRAKHLHAAAKQIVSEYRGKVPKDEIELKKLSGVGPYIAGAVRAFAFDMPVVFIETNIRTALTDHFFPTERKVSDRELFPILAELIKRESPREWYSALMDYGAHLKRSGIRINSRSSTYIKQSKFEGSNRQIRGQILKLLAKQPMSKNSLLAHASADSVRAKIQLENLLKEGLVTKNRNRIELG